jgi:glycosyltransferase involved in cell wall biosynthesis
MTVDLMTSVRKKILIACSHFWPSIGGLETSMGQLGSELAAAGYDVTVMTLAFPGRSADHHQGVTIVSVAMADLSQSIRAAVGSGAYGACLLIQDPLGTIIGSVAQLQPPVHTRLLVQPIINEEGYARWKDNPEFRQRLAGILKSADAALTMTRNSADDRFMREEGVAPVYLPNASAQLAPAGDFRLQFGIPAEQFVILHVANLYWVKNHVGLIDALPDMPANWRLVMIGTPANADCVAAVRAKLAERPEILYIPGLPPEWVAAAMRAADVMVLASHGEGSPITLLEAMSHSKPWLATPQCGAANDHLGGFISDLPGFMPRLRQLAADPALRRELGAISHDHWTQCYAWPVVLQGWMDLIEAGRLRRSFEPDAGLVERMRQIGSRMTGSGSASASADTGLPRVALLVEPASPEAALAAALALALAERYAFHIMHGDSRDQPDDGAGRADVLVDLRREAAYASRPGAAPCVTRAMLADGLRAVDYSVFRVDAYREGPVRFGWIGNPNERGDEVHGLLLPAMGERHTMAIVGEQAGPGELADFLQTIDVLVLTSDREYALAAAVAAMACAVSPVGIRQGRLTGLLAHQPSGLLAERSGAALHEALNWCADNATELRRRGYRQAQQMALHAPDALLPGEWERLLDQALSKA